MKRAIYLAVAIAVFGASFAAPAHARNTTLLFDVKDAVSHGAGNANLKDVAYYFAGQSHPGVEKKIGTWTSNRSSRGIFRTDEASCQVAFLSALIQLQARAQAEGGDAIVDIVSVTRSERSSSATQYRCVAGSVVVHVGLEGTVVKLNK